jgi:hypothetical protein
VLKGLLDSADTLDAFAAGLSPDTGAGTSFATEKGRLPCRSLARSCACRTRPMPPGSAAPA